MLLGRILRSSSGILLPGAVGGQTDDTIEDYQIVHVSYSDVYGKTPSEADLIAKLKQYNRTELLTVLTKIGLVLHNEGRFSQTLQGSLASTLFPDALQSGVQEFRRRYEKSVVIFDQQLLALMKLVIRHCNEELPYKLTDLAERQSFAESLLMVGDFLESESPDLSSFTTEEEQKWALTEMFIRNTALHASENPMNLIVRYYYLLKVLPHSSDSRASEHYLNLEDEYNQITALSLDLLIDVGIALLSQYLKVDSQLVNEKPDVFFDGETAFSSTSISQDAAKKVLQSLSRDADQFLDAFQEEHSQTQRFYYSFISMRATPLLKLQDEVYAPVSLPFLQEKMSKGIYWTFFDHFKDADPEKWQHFTQFFGLLFQQYVEEILEHIFPTSSILAQQYFGEFTFDGKESPDASIVYPDTQDVVFVEVKAKRLRMQQTIVTGDFEEFKKDLQRIVLGEQKGQRFDKKGAGQLHGRIEDFKSEGFHLGSFSVHHVNRYYPVIVTIEDIPQWDWIWEVIDQWLYDYGFLQNEDVARLQIISIEELEVIESVIENEGVRFVDLLKAKADSTEYRCEPIRHMLYREYSQTKKSQFLQNEFHRIIEEVVNRLFPDCESTEQQGKTDTI